VIFDTTLHSYQEMRYVMESAERARGRSSLAKDANVQKKIARSAGVLRNKEAASLVSKRREQPTNQAIDVHTPPTSQS